MNTQPKSKRPFYAKKRFIIPAALVALALVGSLNNAETETETKDEPATKTVQAAEPTKEAAPEKKVEQPKKARPVAKATRVKAAKILREFEENEAAADLKYKGKTLAVAGFVNKVDTEFWNDEQYVVNVSNGEEYAFWTVNCGDQKSDDVAALKVGDPITVVGKFKDGGDLGVDLSKCEIAK